MIILKDPQRAKELGIISVKAQLTGGTADWSSLFGMLTLGAAIAGLIIFAVITSWVFGREFSDHTAKELMALPTSRGSIVAAKFVLVFLWQMSLSIFIFLVTLGVGAAVENSGLVCGIGMAVLWVYALGRFALHHAHDAGGMDCECRAWVFASHSVGLY